MPARRVEATEPQPVPRMAGYLPGVGAVDLDRLAAQLAPGRPVVPIIFYRALLLAADTAAIDALCEALAARGLAPAPLVITSLKEADAAEFVRAALARLAPAVVLTTTAFAAGGEPGEPTPLDGPDVPVLQVVIATTKRAAWRDSPRGLGAADLAMHVVLPELDGRVLAGAVAFKDPLPPQDGLAFTALANRPEPDRIAFVADRVAALARLRTTPRSERRIAVLLPDYPGAPGRTGYAVGLDVPASVLALLADLGDAGYAVREPPQTPRALLDALDAGAADAALSLDDYARLLASLPADAVARVRAAWGEPADDPDVRDGAFRFRARALRQRPGCAPSRPRALERPARRLSRSGAAAAPCAGRLRPVAAARGQGRCARAHGRARHARMAAGQGGGADRRPASPKLVVGPLPVIYPFIVSNPGEAAQAKRRIAAVTIGHLPPPLVTTGLSGRGARARAAGRRICAGRRPRPPAARAAGAAASSRPRSAPAWRAKPASAPTAVPTRRCAASMPGSATSRISPSRTACMSTAALPARGRRRSVVAGERRGRTLRPARRARRPARGARPGRRAGARTPRRAADRPQSLHRRSAHAADADRHGPRPARRRRGDPHAPAGARRDAARAGHRPVGQRDACAPAARRSRRASR